MKKSNNQITTDKTLLSHIGAENIVKSEQNIHTISIIEQENKKVYTLKNGTTFVGRASTNDIVINDSSISRKHCYLNLSDNIVKIQDLGSINGLKHNGKSINRTKLNNEDVIQIGKVAIHYSNRIYSVENINNNSYQENTCLMQNLPALTQKDNNKLCRIPNNASAISTKKYRHNTFSSKKTILASLIISILVTSFICVSFYLSFIAPLWQKNISNLENNNSRLKSLSDLLSALSLANDQAKNNNFISALNIIDKFTAKKINAKNQNQPLQLQTLAKFRNKWIAIQSEQNNSKKDNKKYIKAVTSLPDKIREKFALGIHKYKNGQKLSACKTIKAVANCQPPVKPWSKKAKSFYQRKCLSAVFS